MTKTYININGDVRDASQIDSHKANRNFRDAWYFEGNAIEIDIEKAKEIWRNKLRVDRQPLLQKLDADWFIAAECGSKTKQKEIAEQKQKLRDITKHEAIDNAQTVDELQSLTIEKLMEI